MAHVPSSDEEIAIIRSKLEQATKQLAVKDLEIDALKQEVASLRQSCSQTDVTKVYTTSLSIVQIDWDVNENEHTIQAPVPTTCSTLLSKKSSVSFSDGNTVQEENTAQTSPPVDELPYINGQGQSQVGLEERVPENEDKISCEDPSDSTRSPSTKDNEIDSLQTTNWGDDQSASWYNTESGWGGDGRDGQESGGELFQPGEAPIERWRESQRRPNSKSWLHRLSFGSDVEYNDLLDLHTLPLKTRLEDDDWLSSDLENVRIDDERLFRLLTRGRELAQKCLSAFMDKNQPQICRREFPGGWQQVRLEVSALMPAVDFWALRFRGNSSQLARDALFAVVPLRHLICHWNQFDLGWSRSAPRSADMHLKNVQKLAIHLYEEERAAEARGLRDEARQAVEDSVAEIEALEPLFDVCEWKYHHEQMFEQIEYTKDRPMTDPCRYPDVIVRAAEAWSRRRSSSDRAFENSTPDKDTQAVGNQQLRLEGEVHEKTGESNADTSEEHLPIVVTPSRRRSQCNGYIREKAGKKVAIDVDNILDPTTTTQDESRVRRQKVRPHGPPAIIEKLIGTTKSSWTR